MNQNEILLQAARIIHARVSEMPADQIPATAKQFLEENPDVKQALATLFTLVGSAVVMNETPDA